VVGDSVDRRSGATGGGEYEIEFATGYDDGTVRVCADGCPEDSGEAALSTGQVLPEDLAVGCTSVPRRHVDIPGNTPSCISASADGRWLVSSSFGVFCVWDGYFGHCVATLLGHEAAVVCVDISDCGLIVASCSVDATARVWRLKDGAWSRPIVLLHETMFNSVVLTADRTRAITGDASGLVRVWDAESGALCQLVLHGHDTGITTLAVDFSQVTSGDSGRGESFGRMSRSLKVELRERRARNRSLRGSIRFASRDASSTCFLWNWPREDPVKNLSQISFEQALEQVFVDVLDLTEASRWREQRYSWMNRPDTFTMRASTEENSLGCTVGSVRGFVLEVVPFSPRPDGCECTARVELDSWIQISPMYAFERHERGMLKTIACCVLGDGFVSGV
jgi:WD domain, G-beta repeat